VAVIELDLYAPAGPDPARPRWRPARYRAALLAVILLATLALGGATRPAPTLWKPAGSLTMTPQGTFQLIGGRVFTFDQAGDTLTTTAWALAPMRRRWSVSSQVPLASSEPQGYGWFVRPVGDGVLLMVGRDTTMLDAVTGAVRWHRPAEVVPIAGTYGVQYDETFASGDDIANDDTNSGGVFYGSDGIFHTDPPAHTDVQVVDLATGAVIWTAGFDGGAVASEAPGRPGAVLINSRTGLSLRDLATGTVLASRAAARPPGQDAVFGAPMTDGLLLIAGPGPSPFAAQVVTAYSQTTLAPVWTRPEPPETDGVITVCGDQPCIAGRTDVIVLDPATGRDRWTLDMNGSLRTYGPDIYVVENTQSRVIEVRDPATGAVRADVRSWSSTSAPGGQDPIILSKAERGGSVFGLLRPYGRVQPLGRSGTPVTECQNDARVVVCRTVTGAVAWTYQT
jgi:hypothetical protein